MHNGSLIFPRVSFLAPILSPRVSYIIHSSAKSNIWPDRDVWTSAKRASHLIWHVELPQCTQHASAAIGFPIYGKRKRKPNIAHLSSGLFLCFCGEGKKGPKIAPRSSTKKGPKIPSRLSILFLSFYREGKRAPNITPRSSARFWSFSGEEKRGPQIPPL